MKKRMLVVVVALLLSTAMIVTGCGGSKSASGDKVYKVATDATYAPMEYMDANGKIVGLDNDIVNEIAKAAGIKVEFINYGWEQLFQALKITR